MRVVSTGPCTHAAEAENDERVPFGVVGMNHRSAPLELRSLVSMDEGAIRMFLAEARRRGLDECVVLSTCNRTEIYYAGGAAHTIVTMLAERAGMSEDEFRTHLYEKFCGCAACHGFRVASGLDSAVLGETEIVAQVKSAWALAREEGATGPMLDLLMQRALEASKRVRTETELCRTVTSTASLAVRMVREKLDGISGKRALIVGAGQIARRLAQELRDAGAQVRIVNRTYARAVDFAAEYEGVATPIENLDVEVAAVDAIFAAATVTAPILTAKVFALREGRRIPVIDMGVPANVEKEIRGVDLVDIDALTAQCNDNQQARLDTFPAALTLLDEELNRFHKTLAQRTAAPTIRALVARGEEIRARNVQWAKEKLKHLDAKDLRVIEDMARRMMIGLLEQPIDGLKGDLSAKEHRHVVEQLFGLQCEEPNH